MRQMINEGKTKRHNGPKTPLAAMKHADWEENKDNFIKGGQHKTSRKDRMDKPKYKKNFEDELDEMTERIYAKIINELRKRQ